MQIIKENLDLFSSSDKEIINLSLKITDKRIQDRQKEFNHIFELCEDNYMEYKLKNAKNLLEFAETIAFKSGIKNWEDSVIKLKKKVDRSLSILHELKNLSIDNPKQLPPISLQREFAKLEIMWEECKYENGRMDSIHKNVVEEVGNVYKTLENYMKKYGISKIDPVASTTSAIWVSTKKAIGLKSKELKLNHLINSAKRKKSLPLVKEELEKAYKMIQEFPSHFSQENQNNLINLISEVDGKISEININTNKFFSKIDELVNKFKFDSAIEKLTEYKNDLEQKGMLENIERIEISIEIYTLNQKIFEEILKIEGILSQNDKLGAKTALMQLSNDIDDSKDRDKIISNIFDRINKLKKKFTGESYSYSAKKPFDPFDSQDLKLKNVNGSDPLFKKFKSLISKNKKMEKIEIAEKLEISEEDLFEKLIKWKNIDDFQFELSGSLILAQNYSIQKEEQKKIKDKDKEKPTSSSQKSKEEDALDTLDGLLED